MKLSTHINHPATHRFALLIGITAFIVVAFNVSFASMWELWKITEHRHGLVVFPISAFLIWRLRHQLAEIPLAIDARGLLLVGPLALAWIIARLTGIQFAEHMIALAIIPAAVATLAGMKLTRKLLYPLLFLLMATPIGDALVPILMLITADVSAALLKISGIPMLRDGQRMSLPGGEFVVAEICSGLHYLLTGVMVSVLYAYLTYTDFKKRIIIVVITAVTLVFANGVRAYIVMAVASATRMQYLGGRDHVIFGWLLFGVVIMAIMWIGARFADDAAIEGPHRPDSTPVRTSSTALPIIIGLGLVMLAVTVKPLQLEIGATGVALAAAVALFVFIFLLVRGQTLGAETVASRPVAAGALLGRGRAATIVATLVVLISTPRLSAEIENEAAGGIKELDIESIAICESAGSWEEPWIPSFQGADYEQSASLHCSGNQVGIYVAAYASALQGNELISSAHHIVPPSLDVVGASQSYDIAGTTIGEVQITHEQQSSVIWYWYEIGDHISANPLMTKFYQLMALVLRQPAGGRVIVVEADDDGNLELTRQRLAEVAGAIIGVEAGQRRGHDN